MAKPESTADSDSVILIDGSSYVYRAYHALPPLTTSTGQPTGAVRGVTTMVMRILEDHPNSPIGMIFDAKGDTFRHDMYKEYKANRPPMPASVGDWLCILYTCRGEKYRLWHQRSSQWVNSGGLLRFASP